jgi:hypothetical protein
MRKLTTGSPYCESIHISIIKEKQEKVKHGACRRKFLPRDGIKPGHKMLAGFWKEKL